MFVKDRMTPNPITGRPDMSVMDAQEIMKTRGFRHLPVVDETGKLVGLVTRSSLAAALPSDTSSLSRFEISYILDKIKVSSVMLEDIFTTTPDTPIEIAARIMADERIGCLPVMEGVKLVGIITDRDLFFTMVALLGARSEGIRVTVLQPDTIGVIAGLTSAIAKAGGYLTVTVGYYPPDKPGYWITVCKVKNIDQKKLVEAINSIEGTSIQDIREFQESQ